MKILFTDRVAIVTGAGAGLGRAHALGLAERGAKVVVNDLSQEAAQRVADEITAAGGTAVALAANVADFQQVQAMVASVMERWGRIDILINNAGILRDKSFAKMDMTDFRLVVDIHLMGSAYCTKAVWDIMRAQDYGRVLMTSSGSGIFGNFGQANYGAAKAGVVGLMNVLSKEGQKNNVRVNALTPTAATGMTDGLLTPEIANALTPESVTPGVLFLVSEDAPNGIILGAGAGCFAVDRMQETEGIVLRGATLSPEGVAANFEAISRNDAPHSIDSALEQTKRFIQKFNEA